MGFFAWDNYRRVLAPAGARALAVSGVMARASVSTVGLGILQLVAATHGGYASAGITCAMYMVCAALGGVFWGRLADLQGQRWVLHRTSAILAVGAFGLLLFSYTESSLPDLLFAAAITGSGIPPAPAMVRARWTVLHAGSPNLGVAYSMDASLEELIFVAGPPVMGFLHLANPHVGLPAVVITTLVGMLWLSAQPGTEPPIDLLSPQRQNLVLAVRGMPVLFATSFSFGGMLGALDVAVITFAVRRGHEQIGLIALGLWAGASAIGGALYGASRHTLATSRQFAVAVTIVWAGILPLLFVRDLTQMAVLLAISGTAMAPTMAIMTGLAEQISPRKSLTLTLSWITAGTGLGVAAGTALQGWVGDLGRDPLMFLVSITFASLAVVITWKGASSLRRTPARALTGTPWSGQRDQS
ncbi:MFS transporter [Nocardia sp. 2]|uniref:MFS transporter n=1 Tax=Nocardia acididurans TaxID=2802282 RepID=A0ABS1MJQ5_9NOCA|nr:MFS transporter [Nocardia acididurans]MBL1080275.1 MFS transporter [Nocardia acididurans]